MFVLVYHLYSVCCMMQGGDFLPKAREALGYHLGLLHPKLGDTKAQVMRVPWLCGGLHAVRASVLSRER